MYSVPVGACVSSVVPWFFYVFPPVLFVLMRVEISLFNSGILGGILWRVFACQISVCYFVVYGLW